LDDVILEFEFKKTTKLSGLSFKNTHNEMFFFDEWCTLINNFVSEGSVTIKFSDDVGIYFRTKKGFRHVDILSAMQLNIVDDMLANMIKCTNVDGMLKG
jgi:hypothetical protein